MTEEARYITNKPYPRVGYGLDETYDGVVMLGFHAMMGTEDGLLNHTQNSRLEKRFWYNGVESGEIAQFAMFAAHFNVPVIMVTGDEATCREARIFFGNDVTTVAVKKGITRECGILYPFGETRKKIRQGAVEAMKNIKKCKPYKVSFPIKAKCTDNTGKIVEKEINSVFDIFSFYSEE
jgi:D-amino peptidase